MKKKIVEPKFLNKVVDKHELKKLIIWAFRNYGIARAANMADKLKDLGFYYATKAGISLSLEDLRIPPIKHELLRNTLNSIAKTDNSYKRGEITAVERFQKVIDTWHNSSEKLKQEVVKYFQITDPLNSIYMMAFSGARANISQVRQLVGMRGLMSDPQGQIIDLPISSNFREGLTITDYFISSYGARKGLVDTALRTADSGYLTRRLVDVAQDVIIRESNCKTYKGILLEEIVDNQKVLISLKHSLLGRVLAEDIIDNVSNEILAYAGQDIGPDLADTIVNLGYNSVLVRSPITCDSVRSVCQLCYGWNLAHGQMVDLGEAVGIIAAQSIGEPGTQLTMRTFHTGGVFTGELAQTIISPIKAKVKYDKNLLYTPARTRHGDPAMLINADSKIQLVDCNNNNQEDWINLVKGTLILVKDNSIVKAGEIIAEYPLSDRIVTERAQKVVIADFSGSVHLQNIKTNEIYTKNSNIKEVKQGGVAWILSGTVYNIPDHAQLMISKHQKINDHNLLARTQVISKYDGCVYILDTKNNNLTQEILVVTSSKIFINLKVFVNISDGYRNYILQTDKQDRFILQVLPYKKIIHNQIIGDLISDVYKTKTGGIVKYLDLAISNKQIDDHRDYYNILGSGYILWISEETHEINKDISLLLVKSGDFVEAGTEIIKNIFANNSGILEVIHQDSIIREIIIKPGLIYPVNDDDIDIFLNKARGFLRPGENLINSLTTDKLVYWEYIKDENKPFILIRPVIVYSIPTKDIQFNYSDNSFGTNIFTLKLVRRTYFRDGERIKSVAGLDLIKTHLVAELKSEAKHLNCYMEFHKFNIHKPYLCLKFITADTVSIRDSYFGSDKNLYIRTSLLVKNKQNIKKGSVIAQTEIFSSIEGEVLSVQNKKLSNRRILLMTNKDKKSFSIKNNQLIKVQVGDWVYAGDEIATSIFSLDSGKIIAIRDNQITMRIGQPYLISNGSFLNISHESLVQRGENIAILIFERAKTGDIVQGLPRIEEILEARKKSDTSFNPHFVLESRFRLYLNKGLSLYDATRLSLLDVQLSLIKEVQLVYQSQGVDIDDKHIEVIVRQITSKVKIENGGDTDYLPGEMIELQKVESVNKSLSLMNKQQASYHPILLGITKASLNTESFISAASFQETTKVLTDAAISGKLDWLRGLKENVIIGRLIPAGTGFNMYNNCVLKDVNMKFANDSSIIKSITNYQTQKKSSFEDIIVDDRSAHEYNI